MFEHPDVPGPVAGSVPCNPCLTIVQYGIVDRNGGLTAVVHDPVIADHLRHAATRKIHVNAELGLDRWIHWISSRSIARGENRNPRLRAHTPLRPDDNPAAARKIHT